MKIHFCDLCNESVPQSDLDAARAFVRKGRTICAHCEAVMTHAAVDVRSRARANATRATELAREKADEWPATSAGGSTAHTQPAGGFTAAVSGSAPAPDVHSNAHPNAHPNAQHSDFDSRSPHAFASRAGEHAASASAGDIAGPIPTVAPPSPTGAHGGTLVVQRSSSAGVWLALCGLAGLAVAVGVFHDRMTKSEERVGALREEVSRREGDVQMLRRQVGQAEEALRDAERKNAARADLQKERSDALTREIGKLRDERDGALARLSTLENTTTALAQSRDAARLELEQRLAELSRGIAKSEDERRALEERLLSVELAPRPAAAAAPVPETLKDPAWVALVEGLKSENNSLRWEAVNQIGEAKDPASVSFLAPLLKDADVIVRMAAARVLGEIGSKEAVPHLIDALEDSESAMREYTYVALKQITGADLKFEYDANEAERTRRVKAWREWWKKESESPSGS